MGLMYPKPKKARKKSKHISNPRITEYIPCTVCYRRGQNFPNRAYATHEVFHNGRSSVRNMCVNNKWQEKVCLDCDEEIHRSDGKLDRELKEDWQQSIMEETGWSDDEWRQHTGLRNYL